MDFSLLFDWIGEPIVAALGGLAVGLLFGFSAQRSRFCLRSAILDLTEGRGKPAGGHRFGVWLAAFGAALAATQLLVASGTLELESVRQLSTARSLSGVLAGGLVFGVGMVLTRGCVSRLTVLSATGNLRAVFSLAVFAVVAYATFDGFLTPLRHWVLGLAPLESHVDLSLLSRFDASPLAGAAAGALVIGAASFVARSSGTGWSTMLGAVLVGLTIASGWWFTHEISGQAFEPVTVESVSFTRPALDAINWTSAGFHTPGLGFGIGLLIGVIAGAFTAGLVACELRIEWFESTRHSFRYSVGAALMGFGGVVAGGCSVGAGLTGGSLGAIPSLLALASMAAGVGATHLALRLLAHSSQSTVPIPVAAK